MAVMRRLLLLAAPFAALTMIAAVPRHVLTGDYWGGYAGTHNVPAPRAAQWLSLAEVSAQDSTQMSALGVKTMLYTNPNREMPGDPMWGTQDDEYAHTCNGERARGESQYQNIFMTNPASATTVRLWQTSVQRHEEGAHFDFIFADEADGAAYAQDMPCGYNLPNWLAQENRLFAALNQPIIYNALSDFKDHGPAPEMVLNAHAAGGEMEECYAQLHPDHRVGGWQWYATEQTELRMAQAHKYFICYGRDLTPAEQAYDGRMYTYASYLLNYDPNTTVLWEYYKTPSGGHVMPESQLVALDPDRHVDRMAQLRIAGGAYARSYRRCFINGRLVGACVAAVNPDDTAHPIDLRGYRRVLHLQGSGIFDGGRVVLASEAPPSSLAPLEAVIAFK